MIRRDVAERVFERMGTLFTIDADSIVCHCCMKRSFHPQDIAYRYCGNCHVFLDDMERVIRQSLQASLSSL